VRSVCACPTRFGIGYSLGGLVIDHRFIGGEALDQVLSDLRAWGTTAELTYYDEVYALYLLSPK
jgi:hypothetical protein